MNLLKKTLNTKIKNVPQENTNRNRAALEEQKSFDFSLFEIRRALMALNGIKMDTLASSAGGK